MTVNMEIKKMDEKKIESQNSTDSTINIFCFQINKIMLRFKLHFFLYIGAMGSVLVYLPVIAQTRVGISATALATVITSQRLITIFTKPAIGYVVDYFNKLKLVIVSLIILQTMFLFLILIVPPIRQLPETSPILNIKDHINISNKDFEFLMQLIGFEKYCENTFDNRSFLEEYTEKANKSICISQYNKTTLLLCFLQEKEIVNSKTILQDNLKNCCTLNVSESKLNNETFQDVEIKSYFRLSPIQIDISPGALNQSLLCIHEDSYYSSESQVTINDFETLEYWLFGFILICTGICTSSIFTLADTACFETIQKHGGDFGRQRIYGAVGWGALGPIAGLLCDFTNDFLASWILMACLQLLGLWNILQLDLTKPHFSHNILKDVTTVVKSSEFLLFELGVFVNGMGAGIIWVYLVWFLTSLGGSKFLIGLVQYVQCFAGEIPFMFFSTFFIRKVGHINLLSFALVSYAVRFIFYGYLQNPWLVLPMEVVHGFTYGTFYPAIASYGKINAKPGTEATTQSIVFSTHDGLGAGVGCVLSGLAIDHFGAHQSFTYFGIFFFCVTFLNILNSLLTKKKTKVLHLTTVTSH